MKQLLKRMGAAALCLGMLALTACGDHGAARPGEAGGAEPAAPAAMGRYIEEEYPLPEDMGYLEKVAQLSDGTLQILFNKDQGMNVGPWYLYESKDGGKSWTDTGASWLSRLEYASPSASNVDREGNWYVYYSESPKEFIDAVRAGQNPEELSGLRDVEPLEYFIKAAPDGTVTELPAELPRHPSGAGTRGIFISDEGDLILDSWFSVIQAGLPDLQVKNTITLPRSFDGAAVYGGQVAISDRNDVLLYSLETGEKVDGFPCGEPPRMQKNNFAYEGDRRVERVLAAGPEDGALYFADATGIYRRVKGGAVNERLVDGEMTSLNMPSLARTDFIVRPDGTFLVFFSSSDMTNSKYICLGYRFSESAPAVPGTELRVYSLYDNATIRQAMGLFQRRNPDVHVVYTVGMAGNAALVSDALRTLSTELLAGDGPDLLVLDGMPVDSYIEKGVLADLSGLVGEKTASGEWVKNAAGAFLREDGKAHAVPARFKVPMILADGPGSDAVDDLHTYAAWLKGLRDGGKEYTQFLMGNYPLDLLEFFYTYGAQDCFKEDGNLDEGRFRAFLTDLKTLYDLGEHPEDDAFTYSGAADEFSWNTLHWAYDKIPAAVGNIKALSDLANPDACITKRGGGFLRPFGGRFLPRTVLGVNANSENAALAQSFLELTLSEEVQKNDFEDGLPVNAAAFEKGLADPYQPYDDGMYMATEAEDGAPLEMRVRWPSEAFMRQAANQILALESPALPSEVVQEMLQKETVDYFAGKRTLDEAVSAFAQKLNLYLAE